MILSPVVCKVVCTHCGLVIDPFGIDKRRTPIVREVLVDLFCIHIFAVHCADSFDTRATVPAKNLLMLYQYYQLANWRTLHSC